MSDAPAPPASSADDAALVLRAQAGEPGAFAHLLRRHAADLRPVILRRVRDAVEEVCPEVRRSVLVGTVVSTAPVKPAVAVHPPSRSAPAAPVALRSPLHEDLALPEPAVPVLRARPRPAVAGSD